jgi:CheY-like chemotaxis protein
LIIDNDLRVGVDLGAILPRRGYAVQTATGSGQALLEDAITRAWRFRPHVAIVDVRLLDESRPELSGLELLNQLKPARCILYSAYLTSSVTMKAGHEYHAFAWVDKADPPRVLLNWIEDAVQEACCRDPGLRVHLPEVYSPERIRDTLFDSEEDVPASLVPDVLYQLFRASQEVKLESLEGGVVTPGTLSRGHSVVLKAQRSDRLAPLVVKLAPHDHIEAEWKNYTAFVHQNLPGLHNSAIEGQPVSFWNLGGILYSYVGAPHNTLPTFKAYYRGQPQAGAALKPLRHLFRETWAGHYRNCKPLEQSLYQAYDEALHLEKRLAGGAAERRELSFPGLPVTLPNPLAWVARHKEESRLVGAMQAVTHGDLHGDNLFVEGEYAWLIDFERTGWGHALRDAAELEVDLFTRILPWHGGDPGGLFELAAGMAGSFDPRRGWSVRPTAFSDPELRKVFKVAGELRKLAFEASPWADERELLWALLLDCLFLAAYDPRNRSQQERAMLYGGVLCSRLSRWGQAWPPSDWPLPPALRSGRAAPRRRRAGGSASPDQAALALLMEALQWRSPEGLHGAGGWEELARQVNAARLAALEQRIRQTLDSLRRFNIEIDDARQTLAEGPRLSRLEREQAEANLARLQAEQAAAAEQLQDLLAQVYRQGG